ncbi:unnamed protein product [Blepharisma stoltei]|uniref:Uncharacterized protein n=1 Tax=Blepharisma stoltei TaxID=1481888 RepID=A0AAU9IZ49_9CILI|nr:unnamed protein product [Blepharisma stoltei]
MDLDSSQEILKLSDCEEDSIKLAILSNLLIKYIGLKRKPTHRRAFRFKSSYPFGLKSSISSYDSSRSTLSLNSEPDPFLISQSFSIVSYDIPELNFSTSECHKWIYNLKIYSNEEFEIIRHNFLKLYTTHKTEGGSRIEKCEPQVHIKNVIQYFLDCCICTHHLLNQLLAPIKVAQWIDLKSFSHSIEVIQQEIFDKASFFYKEPKSEFKKNITMQKLLFFFKMLEFKHERSLGKDELRYVISMALKKRKKQANQQKIVEWTFDKAKVLSGKNKSTVSFDEFYIILRN